MLNETPLYVIRRDRVLLSCLGRFIEGCIEMNTLLIKKSRQWVTAVHASTELVRLSFALMAAAAGCAAVYALNPALPAQRYGLTGLILVCMTAAACAINDYYDIDKDRVNHSQRPLPSGRLSPRHAWWLAIALFAVAVLAAIPLGMNVLTLVVVSAVLLWYYSNLLNYSGILGNVLVATIIALLLLLSSFVANRPFALLYPTGLLFCYALAREILLDVHDAEGDRIQDVRTIANTWGKKTAFKSIWILLAAMLASLPIAALLGLISHPLWFIGCVLIMLLDFTVVMVRYQRQQTEKNYEQLVFWERLGMIFGVMGLLGS